MHIVSAEELSNHIKTSPLSAVKEADAAFDSNIKRVAERIGTIASEKPIVLLTGPSGSGKTTAAKMLERHLDRSGHEAHTISLDNYYYHRPDGKLPMDEDGNVDLESPLFLDTELLKAHMRAIKKCEVCEIPVFDFKSQKRLEERMLLQRRPGDIVIFEGIHALNPTVAADREYATGIYISVRTRVSCGNIVLHPSLIRLIRRLLRDKSTRAQSFENTIDRLKSVARGERLFIAPYKNSADEQIDSFCPYELAAYRDLVLPALSSFSERYLREKEVYDALTVLQSSPSLDTSLIPEDSLIREFLGSL